MKLSTIGRLETRMLRVAAEQALKQVAEQFGVAVSGGSASFDHHSCTIKFEFRLPGEDGTPSTREAGDFKRYAEMYGLKADDLGRTFTTANLQAVHFEQRPVQYRVAGLAMRSKRLPILAERVSDGRMFKFAAAAVKAALAREAQ